MAREYDHCNKLAARMHRELLYAAAFRSIRRIVRGDFPRIDWADVVARVSTLEVLAGEAINAAGESDLSTMAELARQGLGLDDGADFEQLPAANEHPQTADVIWAMSHAAELRRVAVAMGEIAELLGLTAQEHLTVDLGEYEVDCVECLLGLVVDHEKVVERVRRLAGAENEADQ